MNIEYNLMHYIVFNILKLKFCHLIHTDPAHILLDLYLSIAFSYSVVNSIVFSILNSNCLLMCIRKQLAMRILLCILGMMLTVGFLYVYFMSI